MEKLDLLFELSESVAYRKLANYISTYYYKYTKEELSDIIVQLVFTLYDNNLTEHAIDFKELIERLDMF